MRISAVLFLKLVVIQLSNQKKWVNVHEAKEAKWNLLIFIDETKEMKNVEFKPPLNGVMTYLHDISTHSKVALATSERSFVLEWQQKSNLSDHFSAMEMYLNDTMFCGITISYEYWNLIVNKLFGKSSIDASNDNVIFYINSCTMNNVPEFNPSKKTYVVIICAEGKLEHGTHRSGWSSIKAAITQSSTAMKNISIHEYTTYEEYRKYLDSKYANTKEEVDSCKFGFNKICQYLNPNKTHPKGICLALQERNSHHRQSCGPNDTTPTRVCQNGDCPCDNEDSTSIFIEDCNENGYQRNWSLNPTCDQTVSVQVCIKSHNVTPFLHQNSTLNEAVTGQGKSDKNMKKIGDIIVPIVIGILFLLIIVVIIVVIVMVNCKAKKDKEPEKSFKSVTVSKKSITASKKSVTASKKSVTGSKKSVTASKKSVKSFEAPKSLLPSGKNAQKSNIDRNKKTANPLPKSPSVANPNSKKGKKSKK